jgi:hypothetical protein
MQQNEIKEQHKETFKKKQKKMKKIIITNENNKSTLKNVVNCDEKLKSCKM